jgi:hypothetical protein
MRARSPLLNLTVLVAGLAVLVLVFFLRAGQNYRTQDNFNSNFFFFWLSGRMVVTGENPYDSLQYLAGHDAAGVTWKPNLIFPYPLPLSVFMVPLGLLSITKAYFALQITSQVILTGAALAVLAQWRSLSHWRMLVPVVLFLLFYGPAYLTLKVGAIGALALLFVLLSILSFGSGRSVLGGAFLAMTLLKPPQGLTILLLAGIWILARRDWKAILGIGLGGLGLLIIGLIQDPYWLVKFFNASRAVMDRSQGVQSNVWAFASLACGGRSLCSTTFGVAASLGVIGLGAIFLWKEHNRLSTMEAFNIIVPLGFLATIYLWSYDQVLYVLPITWITGTLVERTKSYLPAFVFLVVTTLVSLAALSLFAYTLKDEWSLANTVIVIAMLLWLFYTRVDRRQKGSFKRVSGD